MYFYIFGDNGFDKAIKGIPLNNIEKIYSSKLQEGYLNIYKVPYNEFNYLCSEYTTDYLTNDCNDNFSSVSIYPDSPQQEWKDEWGWWRWTEGSLIEGGPYHTFIIKGKSVNLYYDEQSLVDYANLMRDDFEKDDYWPPITSAKEVPDYIYRDYFLNYGAFNDILDYSHTIWELSKIGNIIALIVANAKLNHMSLVEFMEIVYSANLLNNSAQIELTY